MLFKKTLTATAMTVAMTLCAFNASAASTDTTLLVKGLFTPGACLPSFVGGNTADFGTNSLENLAPTSGTNKLVQLGGKSMMLQVECTSPTLVAVFSTDQRVDTRVGLDSTHKIENAYGVNLDQPVGATANGFGLGKTNANGVNTGVYSIAVDNKNVTATGVDGSNNSIDLSIDVISTTDYTTATPVWEKNTGYAVFCGTTSGCGSYVGYAVSVAEKGKTTPIAVKKLNLGLWVAAAVQDYSVLGTSDKTELDGNATISIYYL
ncbi:TPA: DUF1120 domain-containing protein [Escherichia coli]|nr:DUF1120 domain-containing protein [Escherichia coli]MBB8070900.1 DUF1120 domain-containing protein [Escherichia coli]HDW8578478.1 DUF1120 domain-containing protein [Escherichia coli]HDW8582918.1 DUF1120 domain-containing protein [Escherichia coli]HDW8587689.1 DUF1120 domain-containing protein [Escherichia coli]